MTETEAKLVHGPVRQHLIALTVPMIWGIAAVMSLHFVDTWFIAQLSERHLAAISFTFPVTMVLVSLGIGLMAGTASVLSRVLSTGDLPRVRRLTTDAALLAVILSVLFTVLGLWSMDWLFLALGADRDLLPLIRDYMTTWYIGFIFFLVPMVGFGAIRATGDSKLQSNIMIGVAVVNLVLDPLLIFGLAGMPRMEMQGAALASVLSRALSFFAGYWALRYSKNLIALSLPTTAEFLDSCRRVLHVGLPAAGTNIIIPMAHGIVIAIVAQFGTNAVAAYGTATRIENVIMVVYYAMSAMIGAFAGQNLGAGKTPRIQEAMTLCWRFCIVSGLILAAILALTAPMLLTLFGDNAQVIELGVAYLWIAPVSYGLNGAVMVFNATFNGMGKPMPAIVISMLRMFVLTVPLAYFLSQLLGVYGVFFGVAIANTASGFLAWYWIRWYCGSLEVSENTERVTSSQR